VSPKQEKALFDLGQPGVYFGKREYRFYPNGNLASHIIGFTKINELGVNYAKILGISGVEKAFEKRLSAKTLPKSENNAIELSVDLPVQAEVENVLKEWQKRMGAKAGGVVIMDIHSGEILALASSPDFDANKERDPLKEKKDTSIYFNRVVQGVYEMGSTFKLFAVAQGLESDLFDVDTLIDTTAFRISSRKIEDKYKFNRKSSIYEIIVKSSNVGSARLALMVGEKGLKDIFSTLGLFEPVGLELGEANLTSPIIPKDWRDITLATTGFLFTGIRDGKFFKAGGLYLLIEAAFPDIIFPKSLTILSSRLWKVITAMVPPFLTIFSENIKAFDKSLNSLLTAILIAWKVLVAGSFLKFFGTIALIISANSRVVFISFFFLSLTILFAIFRAFLS
tara:strand:- start:1343 stop:2527 length:1185 start_codon:yes stop_codon:yes gene_type:complete